MTDLTAIILALSDQPTLQEAVSLAITESPQHALLFTSLAQYINLLKSQIPHPPSTNVPLRSGESRVPKKRRIDESETDAKTVPPNGAAKIPSAGSNGVATGEVWKSETVEVVLSVPEISFTVPVRKKLTLELVKEGLRARVPSGGVEFGVAWQDAAHIQLLPIPEKPTRQYALTIFPASPDSEAIVLTLLDMVPKSISPASAMPSDTSNITYRTLLLTYLSALLPPPVTVIEPSSKTFVSAVPQPHRPKEPAFHVKAFRGSKDGYLFFLDTGILWGFKKPLLFLPVDRIIRVAYTSILQRTFNLVVTHEKPSADSGAETEDEEVEFSMMDQKDFEGIDQYIKTRGLEDGSLAVERRAKALHINGKPAPNEEGPEGEGAGAGETELEKAAKEMEMQQQDEEEEEEEDYDPGSEGESEGEGSSSDEEEDGEEVGEMEEGEDEGDEEKE